MSPRAKVPAQRPDRNLATPEEVAEYLGVPVGTLTAWRYRRTGPVFLKVGSHVRYRWPDIAAYERSVEQKTA